MDVCVVVFFKQKTAYEMRISDWSSDVCSSDLIDHRPVGCFDPEARQLLKAPEADRFKLAGEQQTEPAMERFLGVDAFEVVGRIEEVLPSGLALPARQSAKTVQAPRDCRDEAALAAHISRHRSESRGGRLMIGRASCRARVCHDV